MRFGVALGRVHPSRFIEVAEAAEELGFESVWLPEHLVFPTDMSGSPFAGVDHPPVPPTTPVFDAFAFLSFLAGRTSRLRLGTHVYNLGLRHPFVAARSVQTLDVVSNGRAEVGVGAGWLAAEWHAAGLDFDTRGRRLDEALGVCRRLWQEDVVEHHGDFFDFPAVAFEPKPVQQPHPPVSIGGESPAALRRAARYNGWIGLDHTPTSAAPIAEELYRLRDSGERMDPFRVTVGGVLDGDRTLDAYATAGVDRLIVAPWNRSREAVDSLGVFASRFIAD